MPTLLYHIFLSTNLVYLFIHEIFSEASEGLRVKNSVNSNAVRMVLELSRHCWPAGRFFTIGRIKRGSKIDHTQKGCVTSKRNYLRPILQGSISRQGRVDLLFDGQSASSAIQFNQDFDDKRQWTLASAQSKSFISNERIYTELRNPWQFNDGWDSLGITLFFVRPLLVPDYR